MIDYTNKNYITTLFDKAIHYVLTKYYNINFSKINLKQYQQNMFKNKGDKDRGICGLVALFSAFGKYFKNNSMKTIDNLTKLSVNIRNDMHNLVSYINQYELQEDYSLIMNTICTIDLYCNLKNSNFIAANLIHEYVSNSKG